MSQTIQKLVQILGKTKTKLIYLVFIKTIKKTCDLGAHLSRMLEN